MVVAEVVALLLAERGVRQVFGVVGSGNFVVTTTLAGRGVPFVAARHEENAAMMAVGYAQAGGHVGVCSVHQGPGLTNTMTALTEAAKSRTPMLVLAADTPSASVSSNFRIEQDRMVEAVGAVAERLHAPASALVDADRAWMRAVVERRPVVLMMPLDVQAAKAPDTPPPAPRPGPAPSRPAARSVDDAADVLGRAERPLVIAGRGAALAGARDVLDQLGERLGALFATSAVANGFFRGSPWDLGISGGFASPEAARLIPQADAVLAVGASLNMWTTRHGALLGPSARVIQIDAEGGAIGTHRPVDVALVGDAAESVRALLDALPDPRPGWRTPELEARLAAASWREVPYTDEGGGGHIDPRTFSLELDRRLPEARALSVDSGHFMFWPSAYVRVPCADAFVFPQAFQAVGLGLGAAIGAAIARPERLTVAALGDGGVLMSLADLETVARIGLRLVVAVYDDAAYGAEVHHFGPDDHPLDLVRFPDTDIAGIARAMGMAAATIRAPEDMDALTEWLSSDAAGALLLDAKVVPTVVGEWLPEAFRH